MIDLCDYLPGVRRKASYIARRHHLDEVSVESEYLAVMRRCVDTYEPPQGDFRHVLNVALNVETAKTVVEAMQEAHMLAELAATDVLGPQAL